MLALRTVLNALRDHLQHQEVLDLAAQLPVLIRGYYFDGWTPSKTPVKEAFLEKQLGL